MRILNFILKWFRSEPPKCDHTYFPVPDGAGWYLGQECSLCGKFNSMKDMGLVEKDPRNARP